jgi:tRNA (guanine37-N1)-methyltransferase
MRVDFVTIFPELCSGFLNYGLILQAREKQILDLQIHDLRNFTHDRHRTVDDVPYGGGPGMVFKPEPLFEAIETIRQPGGLVIMPGPQGEPFSRKIAEELSAATQLVFICGRYEGVDERVSEALGDREISIGDFVTMGGELPSLMMVEAIARFVPGVVGRQESVLGDSFQDSLLDYAHYTRPEEFHGLRVPPVLLSGNHEQIRRWRRKMALRRTRERRPDLLARLVLSEEDRRLLAEIEHEQREHESTEITKR